MLRRRPSRRRPAASPEPLLPPLGPPRGLEALLLDADGDCFAVLSWPLARPVIPPGLTPAEREVAVLAIEGHSNREIARRRRTSERTVANQIAAVLRKTQAASRSGLHALAARGDRARESR